PRRLGPHLAAGSFRRAVTAHVVSILTALAIVAATWLWIEGTGDFSLQGMREWLALRILVLADASARTQFSWVPALLVVGSIPIGELAMLLLGTALMPWCAAGDRTSSVWKRSVKNVYWSTTILVPFTLATCAVVIAVEGWNNIRGVDATVLVVIVASLAWPFLLIRM